MRRISLATEIVLIISVVGCQQQVTPAPGKASVALRVEARPKSGVREPMVRVAVYDAAPVKAGPTGQFEHFDYAHLSDIIVWLEPAASHAPAVAAPGSLEVNVDKPSTAVHPASVGQTIVCTNRSSHPVTLYSVSDGNDFELPPLAPGATNSFMIHSEGLIEILADPGKPPVALVYAANSQWVASARAGQTVNFRDLPPGSYQALSWHPRLPGSATDLVLPAGQTTRATLSIGVHALGQSH